MTTKKCSKCGVEKSLEEFGPRQDSSDRHLNRCRDCIRGYLLIPKLIAKSGFKFCSKCGKEKPLSEFSRDKYKKSGVKSSCGVCCSAAEVAYFLRTKPDYKKMKPKPTVKRCTICNAEKPISEFYHRDGGKKHRSSCKICVDKQNKLFYEGNPEKVEKYRERLRSPELRARAKLSTKNYKNQNPIKCKELRDKAQEVYYQKHPECQLTNSEAFIVSKTIGPTIRKRDGYKCQLCGGRGEVVHHIFPKKRNPSKINDALNLVTLCKVCHLHKAHAGCFRRWDVQIARKLKKIAIVNSKEKK